MKRGEPLKWTSGLGRSTPLVARTELHSTTGLSRGVPMQRGEGLSRGGNPGEGRNGRERGAGAASRRGLDRDLSKLVRRRDGGCAGCGAVDVRLEVHHRRRKGMGGSKLLDHPANLLCLCGWGNHTGCHGWAHTWSATSAAASGLIVPEGTPPAEWPVRYAPSLGGGWWLLSDHGDRIQVDPPEAPAGLDDPTGGNHECR